MFNNRLLIASQVTTPDSNALGNKITSGFNIMRNVAACIITHNKNNQLNQRTKKSHTDDRICTYKYMSVIFITAFIFLKLTCI